MFKIGLIGIIGTCIAVSLGIICYFMHVEGGLLLVITLVTEAIVLQIDFGERLRKEYDEIIVGLNLSRAIDHDKVFVSMLHELVRALGGIFEEGIPLFKKQSHEQLVSFVDMIKNMHSGSMQLNDPREIQVTGIWLLDNLEKSLFATSLITMENFWLKYKGTELHKKNMEAAKRGCKITRVFILDTLSTFNDRRFQEILSEQKEAGVDVRYVMTQDLPKDAVVDFGIWDDKMVCYLELSPDDMVSLQSADYHTSDAKLQNAFKLRRQILDYAKIFTVNSVPRSATFNEQVSQDLLETSAPIMRNFAEQHCTGNYLDKSSCKWYHESWQYLRLLDMVGTPRWHEEFFLSYLSKLVKTSENLDILICALADFEMLAVVLDVIGLRQKTSKLTILDICNTPLKITEWYAKSRNVKIEAVKADAKVTGFSSLRFDVIVTDTFLTKISYEERVPVVNEWHRILKDGGSVLTTVKLNGDNTSSSRANEEQVHAYAERAVEVAKNKKLLGRLDLDELKVRQMATEYAKRNISYPITNVALQELFAGFKTTILNVKPITEYSVTNYAQVEAIKLGHVK